MSFKNQLEMSAKYYNNTHRISEDTSYKKMIMETYNHHISKTTDSLITDIFKDESNFEIYDSKFSPISSPPILIVNHDIIEKNNIISDVSLFYLLNKTNNVMEYPIIIMSSRLFDYGNIQLIDYSILHEIGHYRLSHTDKERNILNEVEADLYAYESLGLEGFIGGYNGLIDYIEEYKIDVNMDEIHRRTKFILNNKGISMRPFE